VRSELDGGFRVRQAARAVTLLRPCIIAALLAGAASGCSKAQISTKFASDFAPGHHSISVFGVYKDGRMSSDSWGDLGRQIAPALGGGQCDPAYGGPVFSANRDLSAAIDDYASANGPTDDLLAQIAPAARGDLILVVTAAGQLPAQKKVSVQDQPHAHGAGSAYRSKAGKSGNKDKEFDPNVLQLSAQLFSVAEGHSVAVVDLKYTGDSADEALAKFTSQLAQSLPGSKCTGWDAEAKLDPDKIRQLGQD
jgi:hypothetical protein